jgi:type II secretory pathway component PulJ
MNRNIHISKTGSRGFSALEVLFATALMTIILGVVFSQLALIQQRSRTEEAKVDIFQESRDFVDQFVRDMHETGYPSIRMFDTANWTTPVASPSSSDTRLATGVIFMSPSEIKFEGDIEGDGDVDVVDYKLVATGNNCPCLQRGWIDKGSGAATLSNEVQNVQSTGTTADPIFAGYTASGTAVTSADMTTTSGKQLLASIKTVRIQLKTKSGTVDPQTDLAPETTLSSVVTIVNCSLATSGQGNSC